MKLSNGFVFVAAVLTPVGVDPLVGSCMFTIAHGKNYKKSSWCFLTELD